MLLGDDVEVGSIDEGHDEGYIGIPAIGLGVREYHKFRSAKSGLYAIRVKGKGEKKIVVAYLYHPLRRHLGQRKQPHIH